jgi:acetylornithine deacetylase/succinyl-diaminopimelate desuccinylase-like protein|tara:strand:+ start:1778 stop:3682 length:1905 start_codon:yes stop_codon:yes gene_type:complete
MRLEQLDEYTRQNIQPNSPLVHEHLEVLKEMVSIDSRSFGVNEFSGDRTDPSDMKEILDCATAYLRRIGFEKIKINTPPTGPVRATPILLAEITVSSEKPTLLFYAHLDKQPYMDDEKFKKWDGVAPTELRWNSDRSRAYGRGAADDLSGVLAIGMATDAILRAVGYDPKNPSPERLQALPCNIKVLYETEEECGSHSLVKQILQNQEFFSDVDGVVITDVINPATGYPGLTTSLRGIVQLEVSLKSCPKAKIDAQTALYKLLATLIRDDHSLAVDAIAGADIPLTKEEREGLSNIPTSVNFLRDTAGLLSETHLAVPAEKTTLLEAQLRKSAVNVRPGHRIAGSIIFGSAGARLSFSSCINPGALQKQLWKFFEGLNPFNLAITLRNLSEKSKTPTFDLILKAATKDPHSGINGGPFPVAELQLARMIDQLVQSNGSIPMEIQEICGTPCEGPVVEIRSLFVGAEEETRLFDDPSAKALVEIRLAPGNHEEKAAKILANHLQRNVLPEHELTVKPDKGASPWITSITHPIFPIALKALGMGYNRTACLYGCGGSIPFVAKLTDAIPGAQPLCLGAYDPDCRMHEPGESLSMADLLGCTRSILHLMARIGKAFPQPKKRIQIGNTMKNSMDTNT